MDYFDTRYWKIAHYWFKTDERTLLRDHYDDAGRKCHFCDQGLPQVEFHEFAHALPDFLGKLSIISFNECDGRNDYFGKGCEGQSE